MRKRAFILPIRQGRPFSIEEVSLSGPKTNEVLVRIVATGVCNTDAVGRDPGVAPYPIVLGHEGAGVVEQVGDNVTRLAPGDHVVLNVSRYRRVFTLSKELDTAKFNAVFRDGVLKLRIPKVEHAQPRRIEVQSA